MQSYNVVLSTDEATVVAEYSPEKQNRIQYQSEAELEDAMIKQLQSQGYEYLELHMPQEMIDNLRVCMQELNGYTFTDSEWDRFFMHCCTQCPQPCHRPLPTHASAGDS